MGSASLYPFFRDRHRSYSRCLFLSFHGYEAPGPLTKKQIFWHRFAAKHTKGNICVGNFHKKYYGVTPDFVTYGGVDIKRENQIKKNKTIAFVGRLSKDTGVLEYLKAMKILSGKEGWHLDIFGDGEL